MMIKQLVCKIIGHAKPYYEAIYRSKYIIKYLTCPRCEKKLSIVIYENNEMIYNGQDVHVVEALLMDD